MKRWHYATVDDWIAGPFPTMRAAKEDAALRFRLRGGKRPWRRGDHYHYADAKLREGYRGTLFVYREDRVPADCPHWLPPSEEN